MVWPSKSPRESLSSDKRKENKERILTFGGIIIGAPGGKKGIGGIMGICGGNDIFDSSSVVNRTNKGY